MEGARRRLGHLSLVLSGASAARPSRTSALAQASECSSSSGSERAPVCLIFGAGSATGSAIARKFAAEGFTVCAVRRDGDKLKGLVEQVARAGGRCLPFGVDCREETAVVGLMEEIERDVGEIEVAVHNIGGNIRFPILQTTARKFKKCWEMAAFTGFLLGREAARHMLPRGRGCIIFTGATASVRGGAGFAAFASAKHSLRALSRSMATELGPRGIHVATVIVDGAIDTAWVRENFGAELEKQARGQPYMVEPDSVATAYLALARQDRSAWTWEMDLRPWVERW